MEQNENENGNVHFKELPEFPTGSHMALFFFGEAELKEIVCPTLEREINKNRRVVYIRNAVDIQWVKDCLKNYDPEKTDSSLKAWTATDISLRRNGFTPRTLMEFYLSESNKSSDEGFSGLTIMLEVTNVLLQLFLEGRFSEFFVDLQNALAMSSDRFIFAYDITKLDKRVLHMIMTEHSCFLYNRTVEFNPFYSNKEENPALRFMNHVRSLNLLKKENEDVRSQNVELLSQKEEAESCIFTLRKEISEHEQNVSRIKEENKQKVERIERIQGQIKADQREKQELEEREKAFQNQLKRKLRTIEDLQKSFNLYKIRHSKFEEELDAKERKIKELSILENDLREKEMAIKESESKYDMLKASLKNADAESEQLTEKIKTIEATLKNTDNEIKRYQSLIAKKEAESIDIKSEMEKTRREFSLIVQALDQYKQVNSDLQKENTNLDKQNNALNIELESNKSETCRLENKLKEAEIKISSLMSENEDACENCETFQMAIDKTESRLLDKDLDIENLKNANHSLKTLIGEKDELLNNTNNKLYKVTSLYEEFKSKAETALEAKKRIEIKQTENLQKIASSIKSLKAQHALDKQKLDEIGFQMEISKERVKVTSLENDSLREENETLTAQTKVLKDSLERLEKQGDKLRAILKATNQNCSSIQQHNMQLKKKLTEAVDKERILIEKEKIIMEEIQSIQADAESMKLMKQEQLNKAEKKHNTLENNYNHLQTQLAELSARNGELIEQTAAYERKLAEEMLLKTEVQKKLEQINAQKEEMSITLSEKESALEQIQLERQRLHEKVKGISNEMSKKEEMLNTGNKEIAKLNDLIATRDKLLEEKTLQINSKQTKMEDMKLTIEELKEKSERYEFQIQSERSVRREKEEELIERSKELETLHNKSKRLRLLIEEKETLLGEEIKKVMSMKDKIEQLKHEKLLLTQGKEAMTKKIKQIETKINSFGKLSSDDGLENYRMQQISRSLSDRKPSE